VEVVIYEADAYYVAGYYLVGGFSSYLYCHFRSPLHQHDETSQRRRPRTQGPISHVMARPRLHLRKYLNRTVPRPSKKSPQTHHPPQPTVSYYRYVSPDLLHIKERMVATFGFFAIVFHGVVGWCVEYGAFCVSGILV